jgi:hypothetical protein
MNRVVITALLASSVILPAFAAVRIPYRANIRGGGGNGKCTIEVQVDNAATVEINGVEGLLISPRGNVATWRRFECNQPMPRNPYNFRFRGIDGRGQQTLQQRPGNNRPAVISILDAGGGREGYTFDIEWDGGGGGGYPGGGYPGGGGGGIVWGGGSRFPVQRAIDVCTQEVRNQARERYGVNNPSFTKVRFDDNLGHDDWIVGRFTARRGDQYRFDCSVNFSNGRVRNVNIQRGW